MKRHGLTAGILATLLAAAAAAQQYDMPNAYQGSCNDCRLLPGLQALFASHCTPVQSCGCCTQKCVQKGCVQKGHVQKGCIQKGCVQKGCVQKGGCVQKAPCQKGCCQKSCCQKSCCQKSCCQKGSVQKGGCGTCGLGGGGLLGMLFGQRCCDSGCCGGGNYAPAPAGAVEGEIPQPRVQGGDPFHDDPVIRPTSVARGGSVLSHR